MVRRLLLFPLVGLGFFFIAAGSPTCPAEVWTVRYTSPGFGVEEAAAMAVDSAGNVYITGSADDTAITLKYDAAGNQLWARTFDVPRTLEDVAIGLTVGDDGTVVVTGGSSDFDTSEAFVVTYDSAGNKLWQTSYAAPKDGAAAGYETAIDKQGNIYMLGATLDSLDDIDSLPNFDVVIVKYSPTGAQQWVSYYRSPRSGFDVGSALDVDAAGNVYITGATQRGTRDEPTIELFVTKFAPSGVSLWQQTYGGGSGVFGFAFGGAIELDPAGNVLIAGSEGANTIVAKYSSSGARQWVARTGTGGIFSGSSARLAVDSAGAAYVAGLAGDGIITYKFDGAGREIWQSPYAADRFDTDVMGLTLDAEGNLYMLADIGDESATLKFGPGGERVWEMKHAEPTGGFDPIGIGVDAASNVFVAGSTGGFRSDDAIIAFRYSQGAP